MIGPPSGAAALTAVPSVSSSSFTFLNIICKLEIVINKILQSKGFIAKCFFFQKDFCKIIKRTNYMRKVNIFVQIWFLRMLLSLRTGEAKIITCPIIILLGVLVLIFSAGLVFQEVIHLSLHALPLSNHLKTSLRKIETLSSSEFQWIFLKNVISF